MAAGDIGCVIRADANGEHVLIDRATGVEYVRGTEAKVRRAAAAGTCAVTDAPRLGPVEPETHGLGTARYPEFVQRVDETVVFRGRLYVRGVDPWVDGVLYPDHLGVGFAERLADVPAFARGVEHLTGRAVPSIRGTAAVAFPGDPPLLGDWLRAGRFQSDRLARRFHQVLGGTWVITAALKDPRVPDNGYWVTIDRLPGT